MKTTFRLLYHPRDSIMSSAVIRSPEMDVDAAFPPGDYVNFFTNWVSVQVKHTHTSVPLDGSPQSREVSLATPFSAVLLVLEEKGWTFLEGREKVVADQLQADSAQKKRASR